MRDSDWEILDALRRDHNLTKVANSLFMTQPALTKRLQQIEKEFNIVIADRNNKGVIFTPQGEYLIEKAGDVLSLLEEVKHHLLLIDEGKTGTLKIGTPHSFGRFVLPSLLQKYKTSHHDINFDIKTGMSGEVVKLVRNKEVHIGFIRGDHDFEGEKYLLDQEEGYVAFNKKIQLSDLPKLPRIEYTRDPVTVKLIDNWWRAHFDTLPTIGFQVNNLDSCWEMVLKGLGFGIFFGPAIVPESEYFKLSMPTKEGALLERNTWMIYRQDYIETALVNTFIKFVKEMNALY
ncbi:hypothetical protein GCM10011391_21230 [Pullulanibacillus camelliae]|uniref:HTH lysR-type domain-containing protein n=1 Tax=Pullulanibacillus camelliae TaxID=1707096 RepID=A0A8J2VX62_9BACL|nr:LysR family transcriptional regulator [Pullulanibacillus camelliae]GGE42187.1 hypothetical protein GCM10011391_21230 [Pullulanibacillus camelliae]